MDLFDLSGRTAIVTGGARGLGLAAAEGLAACGARVAIVDLDGDAAEAAASSLRAVGRETIASACDVTDMADVTRSFGDAVDAFGSIDILVANAGIGDRGPAEELTADQWRKVMAVNLDGVWHFDQLMGQHLIERSASGSIVNMASIAGLVGLSTGNANYAASKGGVIALTRCLAIEWARHGIRVNAVAPTHFRTPLIEQAMETKPDMEQYFVDNIPLGRLGRAEEIRGPVVFLASDASSMVTGHVLTADGGHTAA